jgi:hypothetical protein
MSCKANGTRGIMDDDRRRLTDLRERLWQRGWLMLMGKNVRAALPASTIALWGMHGSLPSASDHIKEGKGCCPCRNPEGGTGENHS